MWVSILAATYILKTFRESFRYLYKYLKILDYTNTYSINCSLNRTNSTHSSPIKSLEPFQEFNIDTGHRPKLTTKSAEKNHKTLK